MTKYLLLWDDQPAENPATDKTEHTDLFLQVRNLLQSEQCHLNPKIRMEHICQNLNAPPHILLKALKNKGFRNFCHFINHHRIEAAKNMMAQEAFDIYTLETIAEKSGFGTRQAFYNTFERLVGMKPACYRRAVKKQRPALEPDSSAP